MNPIDSAAPRRPDTATFTGPGFESQSGTAIYQLARVHAMHDSPWYRGAEYRETHDFLGHCNDKKTGKLFSLLCCCSVYGWDETHNRPLWVAPFALTDIEGKGFVQCVQPMPGVVTARGSGPNVPNPEFFAEYLVEKGADGSEGVLSYASKNEAWRWMASVPTPNPKIPGDNKPYFMPGRSWRTPSQPGGKLERVMGLEPT